MIRHGPLALLLACLLGLAACGGDKPAPSPPPGPSQWDSMKWDQDSWE